MKTAVVTGASGNLGQAVVKRLLDEGYRVIGTVVPGHPFSLSPPHPNFDTVSVDLANEDAVQQCFEQLLSTHGRVDALVCTAGGFAAGKIVDTKTSDITQQFQLNFLTAYNIARPAFVHMMEHKQGRIFLVGSRPGAASEHSKGMVAYGLSKSLIFRLAELMNAEAKGSDVVTSVVVPSTIDTPQNRGSMPSAAFDTWVTPQQIADVIYFYCSEAAVALREPVIKVYNKA